MRITLGEMCKSSVSGLLVYCADYKCSHLKTMTPAEVDKWPDSVRLLRASGSSVSDAAIVAPTFGPTLHRRESERRRDNP